MERPFKATYQMLEAEGMIVPGKLAVPNDPKDPKKGREWKRIVDLTLDDHKAVEDYFKSKQE